MKWCPSCLLFHNSRARKPYLREAYSVTLYVIDSEGGIRGNVMPLLALCKRRNIFTH